MEEKTMTNQAVVSIERYDLKFGTWKPKGRGMSNRSMQEKETIAKSIGNVIVKMFEDQKGLKI